MFYTILVTLAKSCFILNKLRPSDGYAKRSYAALTSTTNVPANSEIKSAEAEIAARNDLLPGAVWQ
jgi:hypothetical protein